MVESEVISMHRKMIKKGFTFLLVLVIGIGMFYQFPMKTGTASAAEDYRTWLQMDSRWGNKSLGGNPQYTVAKYGCAVTALAMLCVHAGAVSADNFNPGTVVDHFNSIGGFTSTGAITSWANITSLVSDVKFVSGYDITQRTKSGIASEINAQLKKGYYVLCDVGGHFVLVDSVIGDTVYICDPGRKNSTVMFDEYNVSGISCLRLFKASKSPVSTSPAVTTTTQPKQYLIGKYKTTDYLNYRVQPTTASSSYGVLDNGTSVSVTAISGNWGKISYNNKEAWICLDYAEYISPFEYKTGSYNADEKVKIYDAKAENANVIQEIDINDSFEVTKSSDNWGYVTYNGKSGWLNMNSKVTYNSDKSFANGMYTASAPINVRLLNNISSNIIAVIPEGVEFLADKSANGMTRISYKGISGWAYLYSAEYKYEIPLGEYFINNQNAVIRKEADASSQIIASAVNGYVVEVLNVTNGFCKIKFDTDTAWISYYDLIFAGDEVQLQKGDINGDGIVNERDLSVLNHYIESQQTLPGGISMLRNCEIEAADINNDGLIDNNDVIDFLIMICTR